MGPYRTLAMTVSDGDSRLSLEVSHPTYQAAYELFTPSESGQRSPPTYHRGCWHGVSRGFFSRYRHSPGLFTRKPFVPIERSLRPEDLHPPRGVASN